MAGHTYRQLWPRKIGRCCLCRQGRESASLRWRSINMFCDAVGADPVGTVFFDGLESLMKALDYFLVTPLSLSLGQRSEAVGEGGVKLQHALAVLRKGIINDQMSVSSSGAEVSIQSTPYSSTGLLSPIYTDDHSSSMHVYVLRG